MLDRENVLAVLLKRFPHATAEQVAAAANAIVALPDEWEEVPVREAQPGPHVSAQCSDIRYPAEERPEGVQFRIFKRRDQET